MIKQKRFVKICTDACKKLRKLAPYDTGNLANHAITIEFPQSDTCVIYVDESIAPYMPYTTEPWLSPKWHGKKNPNEGWWQTAVDTVAKQVAKRIKGELKHVDK